MIKNDVWIKKMSLENGMISPFEPELVKAGTISYGVSSFGYDLRLSDEFLFPRPGAPHDIVDPKCVQEDRYEAKRVPHCVLAPHSYVLASSLETFRIPRNILALCTGKSTYSRCGLLVNITPLEPEWEGRITFPVVNSTPFPVRIYPGEGVAQALFFEGPSPEISYADRKGKYQSQHRITLSTV
jgi:dCTP deaminase